eukprot:Rmarinus@m.21456
MNSVTPKENAQLPRDILEWSVEDVVSWLKSIDLAVFADNFRSNCVNGAVLVSLSEHDLKLSLGIQRSLQRRRLIQELSNYTESLCDDVMVKSWSVSHVVTYLVRSGLGRYSAKFRENAVDGRLFLTLTEGSLEEHLGVSNPLHRQRILSEIRRLEESMEDAPSRYGISLYSPHAPSPPQSPHVPAPPSPSSEPPPTTRPPPPSSSAPLATQAAVAAAAALSPTSSAPLSSSWNPRRRKSDDSTGGSRRMRWNGDLTTASNVPRSPGAEVSSIFSSASSPRDRDGKAVELTPQQLRATSFRRKSLDRELQNLPLTLSEERALQRSKSKTLKLSIAERFRKNMANNGGISGAGTPTGGAGAPGGAESSWMGLLRRASASDRSLGSLSMNDSRFKPSRFGTARDELEALGGNDLKAKETPRKKKTTRLLWNESALDNELEMVTNADSQFILLPDSKFRQFWDLILMSVIVYYGVAVPLQMAFDFDVEGDSGWAVWSWVCNGLFLMDIMFNFRTAFSYHGVLVMSPKYIAWNYLRGWFWVDLIASVPLDAIISSSSYSYNKLLRLLRGFKLMRMLRMSRIFERIESYTMVDPSIVRLVKLLLALGFLWHWIGCFYWFIATIEGFHEFDYDSWSPNVDFEDASFASMYGQAFFWAVMVTTGIGRDISPVTNLQTFFTIAAIVLGVMMYAFIIGSASSALSSIDDRNPERTEEFESLKKYFRQRKVPRAIQNKIKDYFEYLWSRDELDGMEGQRFLSKLHPHLRDMLLVAVNEEMVQRVPIFQGISRRCLITLIQKLKSEIHLPGEFIVVEGEIGNEMYFIVQGQLEVLQGHDVDNLHHIRWLSDGGFFGEQALLSPDGERKAHVRAKSYCDLLVLDREDFENLVSEFPEFRRNLERLAASRRCHLRWKMIREIIMIARAIRLFGGTVSLKSIFADGQILRARGLSHGASTMQNSILKFQRRIRETIIGGVEEEEDNCDDNGNDGADVGERSSVASTTDGSSKRRRTGSIWNYISGTSNSASNNIASAAKTLSARGKENGTMEEIAENDESNLYDSGDESEDEPSDTAPRTLGSPEGTKGRDGYDGDGRHAPSEGGGQSHRRLVVPSSSSTTLSLHERRTASGGSKPRVLPPIRTRSPSPSPPSPPQAELVHNQDLSSQTEPLMRSHQLGQPSLLDSHHPRIAPNRGSNPQPQGALDPESPRHSNPVVSPISISAVDAPWSGEQGHVLPGQLYSSGGEDNSSPR